MIANFRKWSVWFGRFPIICWFPKYSYFDGGCYEKRAILWLGLILELSRSKEISPPNTAKAELDELFREIHSSDRYYK